MGRRAAASGPTPAKLSGRPFALLRARRRTRAAPRPARRHPPAAAAALADLIRVGLLPLGKQLTCTRNGTTGRAMVFDGLYTAGRGCYSAHPPALRAATGANSANGWTAWKLPDGRSLADLRQQYQHDEH
jgi:hypothetical protein